MICNSAGRLRGVQAGLVNEQVFLVNASVGLYVALIADRERAKARLGRSQLVAFNLLHIVAQCFLSTFDTQSGNHDFVQNLCIFTQYDL